MLSACRLRGEDAKLLKGWLRELDEANAVVYYHPELPDGFRLVLREPRDGSGYVRHPK